MKLLDIVKFERSSSTMDLETGSLAKRIRASILRAARKKCIESLVVLIAGFGKKPTMSTEIHSSARVSPEASEEHCGRC